MNSEEEKHKKLDYIYSEVKSKLDELVRTTEGLGEKINYLMTFAGVAIVFYAPSFNDPKFLQVPPIVGYMRVFALIGLGMSLLSLTYALLTRTYHRAPNPVKLGSEKSFTIPLYQLKKKKLKAMVEAYKRDSKTNDNISVFIDLSVGLILLSICSIILSSLM